ncbi:MAG: beta-1,6-N-acetylglucosaminyltransferase [Cyanobacteria bacterium P01_A01_bin.116]
MKIAILILCHRDLSLLGIYAKYYPSVDFYIHIDLRSFSLFLNPDLLQQHNVFFIQKRWRTGWAGFNLVEATLSLISAAINSVHHYSYLFLISESCFPLRDESSFHAFCESLQDFCLVKIYRTITPYEQTDRASQNTFKLHLNNFSLFNSRSQFSNPLTRLLSKACQSSLNTFNSVFDYQSSLPCQVFKGSQWMGLPRDAAELILKTPISKKIFRYSFAPDETYLQTILGCFYPKNKLVRFLDKTQSFPSMTYMDWSGTEKPKVLTIEDGEKILASEALFCRKLHLPRSKELISFLVERIFKMPKSQNHIFQNISPYPVNLISKTTVI